MRTIIIITLPSPVDEWSTAANLRRIRGIYEAHPSAENRIRVEYNGKRYSHTDLFRMIQTDKVYRTAKTPAEDTQDTEVDPLEDQGEDGEDLEDITTPDELGE